MADVEPDPLCDRRRYDVPLQIGRTVAEQFLGKLPAGREAVIGAFAECPEHGAFRLTGTLGDDFTQSRRGHADLLHEHLLRIRIGECLLTGEHLEDNQCQGILVGPAAGGAALGLFGRRVGGRTRICAGGYVARDVQGDAEVEDLQLAGGSEADVFGLQVAVDDALGMGIVEGGGKVGDNVARFVERQPASPVEQGAECFAFDKFEDGVRLAADEAEVVDRRDARDGSGWLRVLPRVRGRLRGR